jgi:flagellar biogenesis protein FliO
MQNLRIRPTRTDCSGFPSFGHTLGPRRRRPSRIAAALLAACAIGAPIGLVDSAAHAQASGASSNTPVDAGSPAPAARQNAPRNEGAAPKDGASKDRTPEELGRGGVMEITSVGAEQSARRDGVVIPTEIEPGTPIPAARRSSAEGRALGKASAPQFGEFKSGEAEAGASSTDPAVGAVAAQRPGRSLGAGAEDSSTWSGQVVPTALALAGTIGVIFLARAAVKRFGGTLGGGKRPSGVVEVLARYPFARGHHIVLIKVGRRVLVTHQSAQGIQTLSEFTSPAEVADLIARCEAGSRGTEQFSFDALLRGSEKEFESPALADRKSVQRGRAQRPEFRSSLPPAARGAEIETIDLTRRREVVR